MSMRNGPVHGEDGPAPKGSDHLGLRQWRKLIVGFALAVVLAFVVVAYVFPAFRVVLVQSEIYPRTGYLEIQSRWPYLASVRFSVCGPDGDEILWGVTRWNTERITILGDTPGYYTVRARSGLRTAERVQYLGDL